MKKNLRKGILCILALVIGCLGLTACDENNDNGESGGTLPSHDTTLWFTESELAEKGLSGLTAPTGLTGAMYTYDNWFNDGYSFHQPCPDVDAFEANAQIYFDYFKAHYDGLFGTVSIDRITVDGNENWYGITQKENLSDYFDDNPSKLYKFYYVIDDTLVDGYYRTTAVWSLEIRYEFNTERDDYDFKLYIENEGTSRNGAYTNYYTMR